MLIDSLSLLITFTSFINWLEALMVGLALAVVMIVITPIPMLDRQERTPATLYFYLQWSWLGYLKLKDAFWPFFILFNVVLFYIDYRVQEGSYTVASWVTMHIIMAMPLIYWTGAVWRCSKNSGSRIGSAVARWITIMAYFDYALRWVIYKHFPNILFDCQQMIIQWGDCV